MRPSPTRRVQARVIAAQTDWRASFTATVLVSLVLATCLITAG